MEWQPIETAPKDGTMILAYCADGDKPVAGVVRFEIQRDGSAFWVMPVYHPQVRKMVVSDLTHWMPLPPPPSEGQK